MKRKTILYIFCSENFSGAEIVITRLIEANTLVIPIVICPEGQFANLLKKKGINVIPNNALKSLNRYKNRISNFSLILILAYKFLSINLQILFLTIKYKVKFIHANNLSAAVYVIPSIYLLRLLKLKIYFFWSNHDLVYPGGKRMDDLAIKCINSFDLTLAVSLSVKNKFQIYLHNKIVVLYNGLDLTQFKFSEELRQNFRERLRLGKDLTFAIVGLIIKRKGHLILIEAFNKIAIENPNIKLIIAGKFLPVEYDYQQAVLTAIAVNKQILKIDYTDDIFELYSGIDVLVNSSIPEMSEPLGTTIYEAMACSRIAIASDTGGSKEIIENGVDGFLFQAGDVNELTKTLRYVTENFVDLTIIQTEARKSVQKKFDLNIMVDRYNSIVNDYK